MNFDQYIIEQCKQITKEIKDHPLSGPFRDPLQLSLTKEFWDSYISVISTPMDLTTVKQNLDSNHFKNFECWASDMNLIFDNAIDYNGANTHIGCVAVYLKKFLQKRIDRIYYCNMKNYEAKLYELIKNVNTLLENPPFQLNKEIAKSKELPIIENFTKTRMEKLVRSLNTLGNNKKIPEILDVLKESGEDIDENSNAKIDIARVSRRSILNLEKFVNESKQ
ncbi:hypothetical protein M9Y10_014896 [Tritrichomonas musculus]|uniref:Bromo domain-containing protein n=1 Tax=Tritrichomonas musculus TaxID=1915356 RepID=A0ABR2L0Z1_9EUKA